MRATGGRGRWWGRVGAAGMSPALHLTPLVPAQLVLGPMDVLKLLLLPPGGGGGGGEGGVKGGGRQHYPGSGSVRWDVRVGIWITAWGPFLWSLEEGIVVAVTLPMMTTCRNTVARVKDCASYRALFRDLEGCGSYVRDIKDRTPNGGGLVESDLNSSPCDVGDLPMTTTMIGGGRGGGSGMTLSPMVRIVKMTTSVVTTTTKITGYVAAVHVGTGPAVEGPSNDGRWDHLSARVVAIASLLPPSVVVIIMSICPPLIGTPLLLPRKERLDISVNGQLRHAPTCTTDKEESCGAGLKI
jgi:hypothetical protein